MENSSKITIKSLEKFNEGMMIHILPFRYRNNDLEILLCKVIDGEKYEDFSNFQLQFDLTKIFAAARILVKLLYNKDVILDENVIIF